MGNIVLLDELTINQIAAGEVIERPASVVKEMVENSIDAGATNITVEIKNGGISYIRVTDNGKGIAQDDLEIAFERHATSKIRSAKDLDTVTSMGFRGEALASIAAISRVQMVSKIEDQETGYKIVVEAGDVIEKEELGCQVGTSITVEKLFFNTPVRYKFLKKDYTESGYIEDVITRLALVNPNVSIKLINTGKTVIQTNGNGDLKSVVYSIYGKDIAKNIIDVSYNYENIKVTGVIGTPEISRANRTNQLFFVNKRYIKDKSLYTATEAAYKGLMPAGKFSFVVLDLTMEPSTVDVNVHPAKLEVKFQEGNKVFMAVYNAIKDTLLKKDLKSNNNKTDFGNQSINARSLSFEERLKKLQESKELSKRRVNYKEELKEKKREDSVNEKEKFEVNNDIKVFKEGNSEKNIEDIKEKNEIKEKLISNPIDTSDVLTQLRQMKEKMEKELKEKGIQSSTLAESSVSYNLDNEVIENNEKEENKIEKEEKVNLGNEKFVKENVLDDKTEEKQEERVEINEDIEDNKLNIEIKENEKENEIVEKDEVKENEATQKINNEEIKKEFEDVKQKLEELNDNPQVVSENFDEMYHKLFGKKPLEENEKQEQIKEDKFSAVDIIKDNVSVFEKDEESNKPMYRIVGIAFEKYIIIEMKKEVYIVDSDLVNEKMMYEEIKNLYYNSENKNAQMLLLPDVINLTPKQMNIANDNIKMLEKAGFVFEDFGENTVKLTEVPSICVDLDTKELFIEILEEINKVARTEKKEKEEKFIETLASKVAMKNDKELTLDDAEALMEEFFKLQNTFEVSEGKNIAIQMTKYDIERKFSRK